MSIKRDRFQFKMGDRVEIKSWEEMEREFPSRYGCDISCQCTFTQEMKKFCGRTATVKWVKNDRGGENVIFTNWSDDSEVKFYNFSTDMIKLAYRMGEENEECCDYDPSL